MSFKKINELILTFFYFGKIRTAPGTFGSIAAATLWLGLTNLFGHFQLDYQMQHLFWISLIVAAFAWGLIGIRQYSLDRHEFDHKSIVIDEAIGMFIALELAFYGNNLVDFWSGLFFGAFFFCFALFRYFDIIKPGIIGSCDRKLKNSFGVIFDDVLCGILAGGLTKFALLLGNLKIF